MNYSDLIIWNVGQGLFTMIQNRDNNSWSIFDCGTLAENPKHPKNFILEKVTGLLSSADSIENILISHQDIDHWSMLESILSIYFNVENKCFFKRNKYLCQKMGNEVVLIHALGDGCIFVEHKIFEKEVTADARYTVKKEDEEIYKMVELSGSYTTECSHLYLYLAQDILHGAVSDGEWEAPEFEELLEDLELASILNLLRDEEFWIRWLSYSEEMGIIYEGIEDDVSNLCNYMADELERYDEYAESLCSQRKEVENRPAIKRVIWGGANPEPSCKAMRQLISCLRDLDLIQSYIIWESGGLYIIDGAWPRFAFEMSFLAYDRTLLDLNGRDTSAAEIKKNVTSLVTYLKGGSDWCCILPGDLTVHAFQRLTNCLKIETKMQVLFVAPHHGSGDTNFCVVDDINHSLLGDLMDKIFQENLGSVVVSARARMFGHPSRDFIGLSEQKTKVDPTHKACYGDGCKRHVIDTDNSVYCTEALDLIARQFEYTDDHYTYPSLPVNPKTNQRFHLSTDGSAVRRTPSKRLFL